MLKLVIIVIFGIQSLFYDAGRLSAYAPNDGMNRGILCCGGKFKHGQRHIAYRRWWKLGCNRSVLIYASDTERWALTKIRDAGSFGIYKPPLRNCVAEGRWKVWVKSKPPPGWKWRAVADLSIDLWRDLGKPKSLSRIHLVFLPFKNRELTYLLNTFHLIKRKILEDHSPKNPTKTKRRIFVSNFY